MRKRVEKSALREKIVKKPRNLTLEGEKSKKKQNSPLREEKSEKRRNLTLEVEKSKKKGKTNV